MSYLYILKLSNGNYYIGSTTNLKKRLENHNLGKSTYTSKFLPTELVFKKRFKNYKKAYQAENWIKKQKSKNLVKIIIKEGLVKKFI